MMFSSRGARSAFAPVRKRSGSAQVRYAAAGGSGAAMNF